MPLSPSEEKVVRFIKAQITSVMVELTKPDGMPRITLKRRCKQSEFKLDGVTSTIQACENTTQKQDIMWSTYTWPGSTMAQGWSFAITLRILGHISDAIEQGFSSSKRDIYYLDPEIFGNQRIVDRHIDDIAFTIGVDRAALHVTAAAKGLMAGDCQILLQDTGQPIHAGDFPEGIMIPRVETVERVDLGGIRWVLVVEKEAVFHRLVASKYQHLSGAGKGLIITGKGYPDLSTRAFLRYLSDMKLPPPIFCLTDGDPDGLGIMSTYRYGSMAQAHENMRLCAADIHWLGLRVGELATNREADGAVDDEITITMRPRDRKRARDMLRRSPAFASDRPDAPWRSELQRMLMLNLKAEIEILYDKAGGIEGWLDTRLGEVL